MTVSLDDIVSLCKRRGFMFQGSDIFGGLAGTWDYGPLGVQLKKNLTDVWWKTFVESRDDMVGIDAAILMNPRTWQASGHVDTFTDPMVVCTTCGQSYREDHLDYTKACTKCGSKDAYGQPRQFNLMFETVAGPVTDERNKIYLRPETAQAAVEDAAQDARAASLAARTAAARAALGASWIADSRLNLVTLCASLDAHHAALAATQTAWSAADARAAMAFPAATTAMAALAAPSLGALWSALAASQAARPAWDAMKVMLSPAARTARNAMSALVAHSAMRCSVAKLLDEFSCEYVLLFDIWLYEIYRCLIFFQFFY
jgi:predicted  nucleic acid-binding Zn-ribbon protein